MNLKKSQVVLIQKEGGDVPQPKLFIGTDLIEVVPKVRNLGFVLNRNPHPWIIIKRVFSKFTPF
jgi:hypothetical protein